MKVQDTSIPAVVLKAEHYGGLGIMRSLGRLGVAVYGVEKYAMAPALWSKYCTKGFVWDLDNCSAESSLKFFQSITTRIGPYSILIPTSDEAMTFIAEHAHILKEWFKFPEQPVELIRSLYDKRKMYALARKHGLPVPRTCFPESLGDVVGFAASAEFPLLVKGIDGKAMELKTGKKMVIVKSRAELLEQYIYMEDAHHPNIMIQEYIPGPEDAAWIFNGYFNHSSSPLVTFTGRKIRQNPIYTGMTSLGVTEQNQPVIALAVHFMQSIGYRGIVDIDFRYDERDGDYKILDVNPRVGATFRLFVGSNGMDVIRAMYLDLTRQPVPPTIQKEHRKWIVEDKDLLSAFRYFKDGAMSLKQWVNSLHGIEEAGYFSSDDVLPFLLVWKNHIKRRFEKLLQTKNEEVPRQSFAYQEFRRHVHDEVHQKVTQENV